MLFSEDPYLIKTTQPRDITIFAAAQLQGKRERQEDFFLNFNDECVALADGVGGMPHADVAARLACETAIWGYKQIRIRNTYWNDRKEFLKRIFRSTNIAVWQKQREVGYADGMATTMTVAMVGMRNAWIGAVGDTPAYIFHNTLLRKITSDDIDREGYLTKIMGRQRYGLVPQVYTLDFIEGDMVFLATDGVSRYVSEKDIQRILAEGGNTTQQLTDAVISLLHLAEKKGSTDNMTACLIKRNRN